MALVILILGCLNSNPMVPLIGKRLMEDPDYGELKQRLREERLSKERLDQNKRLLNQRILASKGSFFHRWALALPVPAALLLILAGSAAAFGVGYLIHRSISKAPLSETGYESLSPDPEKGEADFGGLLKEKELPTKAKTPRSTLTVVVIAARAAAIVSDTHKPWIVQTVRKRAKDGLRSRNRRSSPSLMILRKR